MDNEDTFVIVTVVTVMGGVAVQGEKKKRDQKKPEKNLTKKKCLGCLGL